MLYETGNGVSETGNDLILRQGTDFSETGNGRSRDRERLLGRAGFSEDGEWGVASRGTAGRAM